MSSKRNSNKSKSLCKPHSEPYLSSQLAKQPIAMSIGWWHGIRLHASSLQERQQRSVTHQTHVASMVPEFVRISGVRE